MDAYDRSDAIEHALMTRVAEVYAGALNRALKNKAAVLRKIKAVDEGRIKPPRYYVDRDEVAKWREGFIRELLRQNQLIDGIMEELNAAGVEAAELIRSGMREIYEVNRDETVQQLTMRAGQAGISVSFAMPDRRQIDVLMQQEESPFSRLAYDNLGQNPVARRRLQNELAMATILGESQQKIIQRIRRITGQTVAQARRVAQTERTRVQSQARWQAGEEAAAKGVRVIYRWAARMVRTRESHEDLDGKCILQGGVFRTITGAVLRYPGDPSAPAAEIINCHCVLVPDVLLPGEWLDDSGVVRRAA